MRSSWNSCRNSRVGVGDVLWMPLALAKFGVGVSPTYTAQRFEAAWCMIFFMMPSPEPQTLNLRMYPMHCPCDSGVDPRDLSALKYRMERKRLIQACLTLLGIYLRQGEV